MNKFCDCWVPDIITADLSNYRKYEAILYNIFYNDFIIYHPIFNGFPVQIRKHPIENGKEEAFFHITCQDYMKNHDRHPDFRRCERIKWPRKFIENSGCTPAPDENCTGMKIWTSPYKNKERIHLFLEEKRYIVILEKRNSYYLLITAFYVNHPHTMKKLLKDYTKHQKTPV